MDKILEELSKLSPFSSWFEKLGLSKDLSAILSTVTFLILASLLILLLKNAWQILAQKFVRQKTAIQDIKPQFDYLSIKKAKKFFIATQYQNASPTRQEEPGFTHKYIARNKLIPFFLKTAFNEKIEADRFYLILADSGMGKTTFMINLYFTFQSFFSRSKDYKMKLFRFSNPDTLPNIQNFNIDEAKRTVLLLDALDEDLGIISKTPEVSDAEAFKRRVDEIIDLTRNFREVVMTCRTQYFPSQEDDPYELRIKRPDEKGFYTLNKLYISPFNEKEVKKYLNKKYGILPFLNRKKKKRAAEITTKSKHLVMRPMLLSYIDYLIQDNQNYNTTYELYETLVGKWLQREAEKRKSSAERSLFIGNLTKLSHKTAISIYLNWKKDGLLFISKEEAISIAYHSQVELNPEEITGQSLLTYDGFGNWKFAHKSILEFFLAKECFSNPRFLKDMNFAGMDMAKKFYEELNPRFTFIPSSFSILKKKSENKSTLLDWVALDFYVYNTPVNLEEYNKSMKIKFKVERQFTLFDAMSYCNQLNKEKGYRPVYDENCNFLDEQGEITTNLRLVHGFRLPTKDEWESAYFAGAMGAEEQSMLLEIAYPDAIEVTNSFNISFRIGSPEWCFDSEGYCMKTIHKLEQLDTLDKKIGVQQNKGTGTVVGESNQFESFKIETNHNIRKEETKQFLVSFRIVFVP